MGQFRTLDITQYSQYIVKFDKTTKSLINLGQSSTSNIDL